MREVIQKVIAAEAEAKSMVAAAKTEAQRLLSEARKKGQDLVSQARQAAGAQAAQIVEAAIVEAEREKQERLACLAAEIETEVRLDETTRQLAIEGAMRCVCGQGQPTRAVL